MLKRVLIDLEAIKSRKYLIYDNLYTQLRQIYIYYLYRLIEG